MGEYIKEVYLKTSKAWSWFKSNSQVCQSKSEEDWTKLMNELAELIKADGSQLFKDLMKAYLKEFERVAN